MKASFYALGPVPRAGPRAPPRVRAKRPVEVSEPVAGISIGLLVWAALALLPHSAPYNATLLLNLTLLSWNAVTWVAAGLMSVAMVGLLATSFLGHARVLKPEVLVLALVALLLTTTTYVYVSLLDLNGAQGWPNGMLRLAWRHCDGTPYEACLIAPGLQIDDRTPAERTSEAVSFFSASLYGAPLDTTAVTATDGSIDVVFGDTGRAECAVRVVVPAGAGPVLLSLGGEGAAGLAARHGLALVSSPGAPPSACGATGRIAVVAAATNAVAAALLTAGRASVALYGCSIAGKMASYASATFDRDYGRAYDHVFVDSGGSMGLASARHVGRGGEVPATARAPPASRSPTAHCDSLRTRRPSTHSKIAGRAGSPPTPRRAGTRATGHWASMWSTSSSKAVSRARSTIRRPLPMTCGTRPLRCRRQ